MNISNLYKPKVLAALFNAAKPLGMGRLHYRPEHIMDDQEAEKLLDSGQTWFDYHEGRLMKINMATDEINTWGYNRDNGENSAENAVARAFSELNTTEEFFQGLEQLRLNNTL